MVATVDKARVGRAGAAVRGTVAGFGPTLRALREGRGWPPEELVLRAGIEAVRVRGLEAGELRPSPRVARRLGDALGFSRGSGLGC